MSDLLAVGLMSGGPNENYAPQSNLFSCREWIYKELHCAFAFERIRPNEWILALPCLWLY